jgi:hypothetical protein
VGNPAALAFLLWSLRDGLAFDCHDACLPLEVLRISERFADLPFDLADASIAELHYLESARPTLRKAQKNLYSNDTFTVRPCGSLGSVGIIRPPPFVRLLMSNGGN